MIKDSEMMQYSSIESYGGNGAWAVSVRVYRPPEAEARFRTVAEKEYAEQTQEERDAMHVVPDATALLNLFQKQDRMLDPAIKERQRMTRKKFLDCFKSADLQPVFVENIPNQYFNKNEAMVVGNDWFKVTTLLGQFVIGWRKSVISLDWKDTILNTKTVGQKYVPDGREMFPEENVTRWESGIHAWGYEKLIEYLKVISSWESLTERWWD